MLKTIQGLVWQLVLITHLLIVLIEDVWQFVLICSMVMRGLLLSVLINVLHLSTVTMSLKLV